MVFIVLKKNVLILTECVTKPTVIALKVIKEIMMINISLFKRRPTGVQDLVTTMLFER